MIRRTVGNYILVLFVSLNVNTDLLMLIDKYYHYRVLCNKCVTNAINII